MRGCITLGIALAVVTASGDAASRLPYDPRAPHPRPDPDGHYFSLVFVSGGSVEDGAPPPRVNGARLLGSPSPVGYLEDSLRVEYGRRDGVFFPLGGVGVSLLFQNARVFDLADGSAVKTPGPPRVVPRLYLPGIGLRRGLGGLWYLEGAIVPSVALLDYAATASGPPTGTFHDVRTWTPVQTTAAAATIDLQLGACFGAELGGCFQASPILFDASTAGPPTLLAGMRFALALKF